MSMKVAYLTGEYPRATDTFIQREVLGLRSLGLDVETFSIREPDKKHLVGVEQIAEQEKTYYVLPINILKLVMSHLWLLFKFPNNYFETFRVVLQTSQPGIRGLLYQIFYFLESGLLAREICKRDIDHLHNHIASSSCTVAMLAAALGRFKFSFTMHGPHIFFEPRRWRLDEKIKRAKFVACISHFCRSQGMIFVKPEHWDKMPIIRCGVDLELFEPSTHQGKGNRLLYIGRLAVEKGLPIVLESLTKLLPQYPDIVLTVVGDGADRTFLEDMATQVGLGGNVKFVGYQSQAAVREFLKQTDIFVLPSFAEGIPVVLMEAMAMGVPVVATQIAGISELVESGKSGYLVPPGDSVMLASAVSELMSKADMRSQMGLAGRHKVEAEFNIRKSVFTLKEWFSQ